VVLLGSTIVGKRSTMDTLFLTLSLTITLLLGKIHVVGNGSHIKW